MNKIIEAEGEPGWNEIGMVIYVSYLKIFYVVFQ